MGISHPLTEDGWAHISLVFHGSFVDSVHFP
jgi:hypothetical protein